jgi:hypothetical protein
MSLIPDIQAQFNWAAAAGLLLRLAVNTAAAFFVLHGIYRKFNRSNRFAFHLYLFNLVVFLISAILTRMELSAGAGFGLFAAFTMLRYRSEQIKMKEMAYLLVMAALGFVNALSASALPFAEVILLNTITIAGIFLLEYRGRHRPGKLLRIRYEHPGLLFSCDAATLQRDLQERLGVSVEEITLEKIHYKRGYAVLWVRSRKRKFPKCQLAGPPSKGVLPALPGSGEEFRRPEPEIIALPVHG